MKKSLIILGLIVLFCVISVMAGPGDDFYTWSGKWNQSTGVAAVGINTKVIGLNTGSHGCTCASNTPLVSASDGGWSDVTPQMDFKYETCEQCNTSNCLDLTGFGCSNCSMYTGTCYNQLPAQCTVKCLGIVDHCTNNNNGYNTSGQACKNDLTTGQNVWMNTTNATAIGCYEGGTNTTAGDSLTAFGLFVLTCPGIDYPPNVTLISPTNDSTWASGYFVTFVYDAHEQNSVTSCSLIINNAINVTNTTIVNNQTNNMTIQLNNGDYSWSVNCTDNAAQIGASQTWLLHVNVPNAAPIIVSNTTDNSDGNTPINIGNNVTFTVYATDPESSNYYLAVCNSETISQAGVCGGTMLCNSSYVASGAAASCSYNTSQVSNSIVPWWSFVCDSTNCSSYNNYTSPFYVNHYPAYTLIPNITWPEDTVNNSLNLSYYFSDADGNDLNYTSTTPSNIAVSINNNTGIVTLTPDGNFTGVRTIIFTAIDPYGLYNTSNTVTLNVTPVNDAPYLTSINLNVSTGAFGTSVRATSSGAGDVDGDNYVLQCGNSTGDYNLCAGAAGTGERTCDFISQWTDDAVHTVYCVINDSFAISAEKTTTFTSDNTPPGASTILQLEDDTTAPYWDTDNDGHTILQINLAESNMKCRWNDSDVDYSSISSSNDCTVVGTIASCELNVTTQVNQTTRYVSCQDQYGNDQNISQNIDVTFGVDWTIPSVNSNNDGQIHLPGYNVTLTMQDQPSGTIITVYYCNDTSGSCAPVEQWIGTSGDSINVTFNERGTWYLRWNASDAAGNINSTKQTIVFINTLPLFGPQSYTNLTKHIFIVNVTVSDAVGTSQGGSYSCNLFYRKSPAAFTSKSMQLQNGVGANGTYYANISTLDGFSVFDLIDTYVNCSDGMEWNVSSTGSNAIPNIKPSAPVVDVVPNAPITVDDLFCNITTNSTDSDSDAITYLYEWYKGGIPQGINNPLLKTSNTSFGEQWNCTVIPFDGYENGTSASDKVTIAGGAPEFNVSNPIINYTWPEDTVNNSLNLSKHFSDPDNDPLMYYHTHVENITVHINHTTGIVTFIPDANFTGVRYIRFNATDGLLWSSYSNNVTLNVTSVNDAPYLTNISLNVSNGAFGTSVRATSSGAGDIDSASWLLQCGNDTGNYNLCVGSVGTGQRTCDFTAQWTDDAPHDIYCVINDTLAISAEKTATFTSDNSGPLWSSNKTFPISPVEYVAGGNYQFNVTWTDSAGVQGAVIENNFTGTLTNYSMSNLSSEYYYSYNNLGVGSYVWRSYANDSFRNSNYTSQWVYVVQDTTKPNISLISPLTGDILGWTVLLRANVTDPYLDDIWYEVRNGTVAGNVLGSGFMNNIGGDIFNATLYTNETWPYNISAFNSTNLTLIVYANDTSGNLINTSSSWFLDNSMPSIQYINPPQNGMFVNSNFNLNIFLANHKLNYSNYTIYNSSGAVIYSNQTNLASATFTWTDLINVLSLSDGNYTILTYARDSSSPANINNKTTWFYVDKTTPAGMQWVNPTQANGATITTQTQTFNFTCSENFVDSAWINFNGTINNTPSGSSNGAYWWIISGLGDGAYTYTGYCNDTAGNNASTETRSLTVRLLTINTTSYYGLNSSLGYVSTFNTTNLEEIEYAEINYTIRAPGGTLDSWYLNFTAGGTNGCSLGNKQSAICYNYPRWIQFINGTNTATYDGTQGNQGDRIIVVQTGAGDEINLSIRMDEHYNPNVFKWYNALYNFSDIKWQNGTNERISSGANLVKVEVNNSLVPMGADQYKLDFRVQHNTPAYPLEAYACNSSYTTGHPHDFSGCAFIASKLPSELQDDGTKFRGIFTKQLIDSIGDLKYIILEVHETNASKYYAIKTYKATAPAYTTHWEYSTSNGSSWSNSGDGYETELNINWFYDGADPTKLILRLYANKTNSVEFFSETNITWDIDPSQNYPPIVSIARPTPGSNITLPYNVEFTIADPNDDAINASLSVYQGGVLLSTLIHGMNETNVTYYWTQTFQTGLYNLTLKACELGTSNLYCSNDSHEIMIYDQYPQVTITTPSEGDILGWTVVLQANATDNNLDKVWYEIYNETGGKIRTAFMNNIGGTIYNGTLYTNETWPYDITLHNQTNLTIIVYVNDTYGQITNDTNKFILDNTKPSVQYINPLQGGAFYSSDFNLNIFLANHKLSYSNYSISLGATVVKTNSSSLSSATYSWTDLVDVDVLSDGNYTILTYAEDSSEPTHNYNTKTNWFYVDKTAPTGMQWVNPTPANNTSTKVQIQTFNFTCSESFFDSAWINFNGTINRTPSGSSNGAYWWIISGLGDGVYTYTGYCNDTAGNNASTEIRKITIDLTAPIIANIFTIPASPILNNGSSQIIGINFTSNEYPLELVFNLYYANGTLANTQGVYQLNNSGQLPFNYTLQGGLSDSNYILNITASDLATNSVIVHAANITVDTTPPVITLITTDPALPLVNNGSQQRISVNFTSSEYPINITFYLYNSTGSIINISGAWQITTSGQLPFNYTFPAGLLDGNYTLNLTFEDRAGNRNITGLGTVQTDTSVPLVTGAATTPAVINQSQTTNITVTVTDVGGISAVIAKIVETNGSINYYPMLSGAGNIWYYPYTASPNMPAGQFNVTIIANDTLGHINNTVTTSFTVRDIMPPHVAIISPTPGQTIAYGAPVSISVNASDETQLSVVMANVSLGGYYQLITLTDPELDGVYTGTFTNTTSIGTYTLRMLVNDSGGNLNNSVITTFIVQDQNDPSIVNTTVQPRVQMTGRDVFLNATATDDVAVSAVWANIALPNGSIVTKYLSAGDNNYTTQITGRHNVTFFANDTSARMTNTSEFFIVGTPISFNFTTFDFNIIGVNATLKFYYPNTTDEILLEDIIQGSKNMTIANYTYDIRITVDNLGVDLLFRNVDLEKNNPFTLSIDRLDTPAGGFLITYGLNGSFIGIHGINVTLSYNGTGFGDENVLQVYKCNNWNFTGQTCMGTWDLISSITDTADNTVMVDVSNFSGFSIKQGAYCGDGTCSGSETCSSCPGDCGTCPSGGGGGAVSPPKPVYSEIPEEIYVGEDTKLYFYYLDAYNLKAGLKDAIVNIYKWGTDELVASGVTDSNGNFVFVAPYTGNFRIEVKAKGVVGFTAELTSKQFQAPKEISNITTPALVVPATLIQQWILPLVITAIVLLIFLLIFIKLQPYIVSWFIRRAEARRLLASKKRAYDVAEKLMLFIERAAWQGYKKSQIKGMLLSRGWSKKTVDEYVDYTWQEYKKS